jgi:hypothetical protein
MIRPIGAFRNENGLSKVFLSVSRLAMTKMQAVVSSASMMLVNLSLRRSRRLLASSQAFACSTTQRTAPSSWRLAVAGEVA